MARALATTLLSAAGITYAAPPVGDDTATACREDAGKGCLGASDYFEKMRYKSDDSSRAAPTTRRPGIGLALAGGGTRASQFSIGVLKGLHESGVLSKIDYLSTVSGGGYAGYWYISQRVRNEKPEDMFRDCIPHRYEKIAAKLYGVPLDVCKTTDFSSNLGCLCPNVVKIDNNDTITNFTNILVENSTSKEATQFLDPFRHQNNLRGHTDLFSPSFSYANTRSDDRLAPTVIPPIGMQLLTATTIDLVGDTLFDWNLNSSPSRYLYRDGIRRIYGMSPINCADYLSKASRLQSLGSIDSCISYRPLADEMPDATAEASVTFEGLSESIRTGGDLPYWIINATTPVLNCPNANDDDTCLIGELLGSEHYQPHKAIFELTADYWGAGEFGYWRVDQGHQPFGSDLLTLDEAVASSAAFFDPYQRSFTAGGLVNGLLQLTGFRWGYHLKNPHSSSDVRAVHRLIPFPFYFLHHWTENKDTVDIQLIDGGQSDNLGAYSLIRRRVPNIIISDHSSEEESGNMEDICLLRKNLSSREFSQWNGGRIWYIQFDDLEDLDRVCDQLVDPSLMPPSAPQTEQRYRYNVHAWKLPVVRGCAVELDEQQVEQINNLYRAKEISSRSCDEAKNLVLKNTNHDETLRYLNLFLIKPAIDLNLYTGRTSQGGSPTCVNPTNDLKSETEIRGFLKANAKIHDAQDILQFPAHSTINLTLDSSPWLFGAYRELGAQAARKIRVVDGNELTVERDVSADPMRPGISYQVARAACILTAKLVKSFSNNEDYEPPQCTLLARGAIDP